MNTAIPASPSIVVSSRDFDRIEQLLDAPLRAAQPAAVALMAELLRADVVSESDVPDTVVTVGSVVTCVDESSGQQHTLTLVWPHEADVDRHRVSLLTPVGSALLGLSLGQVIDWDAPGGRRLRLRVIAVDRAGAGTPRPA
jgi:regulator of nucleoside diphosphate kinase